MNLFAEQTLKTNLWLPKWTAVGGGIAGGLGLEYAHCGTGGLGLEYAHCGTLWNDCPMGICCIAQGTLLNIL